MNGKETILIVEDEATTAMCLEISLMRDGFNVCKTVATGEEAVDFAMEEMPKVILMDIHLAGDMDGIDAANRIQMHYSPCIIFTTAYADSATTLKVNALNPAGFLQKPFSMSALSAIVAALFTKRTQTPQEK